MVRQRALIPLLSRFKSGWPCSLVMAVGMGYNSNSVKNLKKGECAMRNRVVTSRRNITVGRSRGTVTTFGNRGGRRGGRVGAGGSGG